MKRLTLLILAVLISLTITACSQKEVVEETTTHTIPATQPPVTEPEWAQVDCDISLADPESGNTILYAEDFTNFAVMGTTDEDSYIVLQTTEDAKNFVNSLAEISTLQIIINGNSKDDIVIKAGEFTGEIAFGHNLPYEALCQLASSMRGLY